MLRSLRFVLCALVLSLPLLGCGSKTYDTSLAEQCNNSKKDGDESDVDCGGSCSPCAASRICRTDTDCASATCMRDPSRSIAANVCYEAACRNGRLDTTETDVDCGGSCAPCAVERHCAVDRDCLSAACIAATCYDPSCRNGKLDALVSVADAGVVAGSESDVDCGGPCPACATGKACKEKEDCQIGTPCTNGKCGNPLCFNRTLDVGETDLDCGGVCPACGLGSQCAAAKDCETLNCSLGKCQAPTCADLSRNQGEADVDCGDVALLCKRCDLGATCTADINCASKHCLQGFCVAPTCEDGIVNGSETGMDCGGSCKACPDNSPCLQPTDCVNRVCKNNICTAPTCSDGARNGGETGIDCGGTCLATGQTCPNNQPCNKNADCTFGYCSNNICQPPICANGVFDVGSESDKDCGGSCAPCADNLRCTSDEDCQSKVCEGLICREATCLDRAQNGNETDLNCGGNSCPRCAVGQKCAASSDCTSKVCDANSYKCLTPSCDDSQQNDTETGPDCGGACALQSPSKTCENGFGCKADTDCKKGNCCTALTCGVDINKCVVASCNDGKRDQGETGIDCGGNVTSLGCTTRCSAGQGCLVATDCESGVCGNDQLCQPARCTDGVLNGTEKGPDCGSAACSKPCPDGTPCDGPGDCASGVCTLDATAAPSKGYCAAPSCSDGVQNGTETGLNCGGNCTQKCPPGQGCRVKADCDPAVINVDCIKNICSVPSCKDGSVDGDESDVDCGGTCSDRCANGKACKAHSDCVSGRCSDSGNSTLLCAAATCGDGVQNQGESDADCGGSTLCPRCDTNRMCDLGTDCLSGVCGSNNVCLAPTCTDQSQNQQETDLDCGGPYCRSSTTACDVTKKCLVDMDCKSLWCDASTSTCQTPSCTDTVKNGTESDVNCGGSCTKCDVGKSCNLDQDCTSGWCNSGKCGNPTCTDTIKNGQETGPDCGGNCASTCAAIYDSSCKLCGDGSGCGGAGDCKSLNCATGVCEAQPSSATASPAVCVGRVLDGTSASCNQCDTSGPNVSPSYCRTYLYCFYANNCNPWVNNQLADCANASRNGICSINKVGKTQDALNAAIAAYRCACP